MSPRLTFSMDAVDYMVTSMMILKNHQSILPSFIEKSTQALKSKFRDKYTWLLENFQGIDQSWRYVTKASLLAGVWFPLGMYCRETGYSCNDFHAEPVLGPPGSEWFSNPAVYIVGTMYLMRGKMMTKHKGFLSAHPLSNTFLDIIYYIYMWIVRYIR